MYTRYTADHVRRESPPPHKDVTQSPVSLEEYRRMRRENRQLHIAGWLLGTTFVLGLAGLLGRIARWW